MNEELKSVSIQTSYCLDLICFIDLLCQTNEWGHDEQTAKWEAFISDDAIKSLNEVKRLLEPTETLITTLAPLLVLDEEFNDLKVLEVFESPRYLLNKCKKDITFKGPYKSYKTMILKKGERLLRGITPVIACLERFKFKHEWIETRLPLINAKIKTLQSSFNQTQLTTKLTPYLLEELPAQTVYVLSYYVKPKTAVSLSFNCPKTPHLVAITQSTLEVATDFVTAVVNPIHALNLKKAYKPLRKELALKKQFELVKPDYKNMDQYLDHLLEITLHVMILAEAGYLANPYEYLARYQYGTHKFSVILFDYMKQVSRHQTTSLEAYCQLMCQSVTAAQLQTQFLSIMSAQRHQFDEGISNASHSEV